MLKRIRLETVVFWSMTLCNFGRGYCFRGRVQGRSEEDADAVRVDHRSDRLQRRWPIRLTAETEAKTQYKAIKMMNKKCEKPGTDLNMTFMSALIAPVLATCSPCLEKYYLICDMILGGL